jgi:hypothetical protein
MKNLATSKIDESKEKEIFDVFNYIVQFINNNRHVSDYPSL